MKKIISAALLATAVTTPVLAADQGQSYIAIDTATYAMSNTGFKDPGSVDIVGGYYFANNMGIEVGYMMVGDSTLVDSVGTLTYAQSVVHGSGVFYFPVNDAFEAFAKLGFSSINGKLTGTGSYSAYNYSASTSNLTYGIGAQYKFTPQVAAKLQYEALGKSKAQSTASGVDVTRLSIGVVYNF